jgi:hypothetical protein
MIELKPLHYLHKQTLLTEQPCRGENSGRGNGFDRFCGGTAILVWCGVFVCVWLLLAGENRAGMVELRLSCSWRRYTIIQRVEPQIQRCIEQCCARPAFRNAVDNMSLLIEHLLIRSALQRLHFVHSSMRKLLSHLNCPTRCHS